MFQLLVGTNFPFMKYRRLAYVLSAAFMVATAVWLVTQGGPRYAVDFTGGTLLQIRTSRVLPADQIRAALESAGLSGVELQQIAGENRNEFMLRLKGGQEGGADLFGRVQGAISQAVPGVTVELR